MSPQEMFEKLALMRTILVATFWVVYSSTHYLHTIKDKNGLLMISTHQRNASNSLSVQIFSLLRGQSIEKQANLCLTPSSPSFWPEEEGGHLEYLAEPLPC